MSTTPAGRAGRLRLRRQLAAAGRASALLDRKRRIVASELDRWQLVAARTGEDWERAARQAATWLRRSAALDGQHALEAAAPRDTAEVDVELGGSMGARYPVRADVDLPSGPVRAGSSALVFATEAHRRALVAAVRHAAALRAVSVLMAELAHARAHQRAIDNRWIPRLDETLRVLEAQLDELDREENVRLYWAAELPGGGDRE